MSVLCERTTYVQKDGEIIKILKLDLEYFIGLGWKEFQIPKQLEKGK